MLGTVTTNAPTAFAAPSEATFVDDINVPLDASYPAGGYTGLALLLQKALASSPYAYPFNAQSPRTIVEVITAVDLSGYAVAWDALHQTLRLFTSAAAGSPLAEVVTGTDLHLVTLRIRVLSR